MTALLELHLSLVRLIAESSNLQRTFDEVPSTSGVAPGAKHTNDLRTKAQCLLPRVAIRTSAPVSVPKAPYRAEARCILRSPLDQDTSLHLTRVRVQVSSRAPGIS